MRPESRKILSSAILSKNSKLFLSKNVKKIEKFLSKKGFEVSRSEIEEFLAEQRSNGVVIRNDSGRREAEVSRSMLLSPSFFDWCHTDLMVMSKHRNYGKNSTKYVMIFIDGLSLMTYLTPLNSTQSEVVISAFKKLFTRSPYLPEQCSHLSGDSGSEYRALKVVNFLRSCGIKYHAIASHKLGRKSKGDPVAEIGIRGVRSYLERYENDIADGTPFPEKLKTIENAINSHPRESLGGISSKDALTLDPKYIRTVRHSNRFKRRRYLKKHLQKGVDIETFSVVKVKRNLKKENLGFKESYGIYGSSFFCVLDKKLHDMVYYYVLGDLFQFKPVSELKFSYYQLKVFSNLSIPKARYLNCISASQIISKSNDYCYFKPEHCEKTFFAVKNIFD